MPLNRDEILHRLQRIATDRVPVDPTSLRLDARLEDIGIDSFSLIELVFLAEEEFGIKIPMDRLDVTTIGDVIDVIRYSAATTR